MRRCGVLYRRYKKHQRPSDRLTFLAADNTKKDAIKKAKVDHRNFINKQLTTNTSAKEWWKCINHLTLRDFKPSVPTIEHKNQFYTTSLDKAKILNTHFAKQCSVTIPAGHMPPPLTHLPPHPITCKPKHVLVHELLSKLDPNKATGSDGIPGIFLNKCADFMSKPLAHIYRLSLKHGIVPDVWKHAHVVPVFKKGNHSDPTKYRPISLLP